MHLGYSAISTNGRNKGQYEKVIIEDDNGDRVSLDSLTPALLQQILDEADSITIFGDEGDRQVELNELAEVFFSNIGSHEDWSNGEFSPFNKGLGVTINKTKSATIRGKDNIMLLIDKFAVLLKPKK